MSTVRGIRRPPMDWWHIVKRANSWLRLMRTACIRIPDRLIARFPSSTDLCAHFPTHNYISYWLPTHWSWIKKKWTNIWSRLLRKARHGYCEYCGIYSNIYLWHKHTYTLCMVDSSLQVAKRKAWMPYIRRNGHMAMRRVYLLTQKHNNVHIINYVRGRKHINVSWHLRYVCTIYSVYCLGSTRVLMFG